MEGSTNSREEKSFPSGKHRPPCLSPLPIPCPEEDALRSLLETSGARPLTVTVRADASLYETARRVYSVSALGPVSLLLSGIRSAEAMRNALATCHECYCDLYAEGKECNGFFPRGILIDSQHSPALLSSLPWGYDFLSFDCDRLLAELERERSDSPKERLRRMLEKHRGIERRMLCRSVFDAELAELCRSLHVREIYLPPTLLPLNKFQ